MGCPTNAKQSMLVTTIPSALDHGATLMVETRAQQFELVNGAHHGHCAALRSNRMERPLNQRQALRNSSKALCTGSRRDQLGGPAAALAGARPPCSSGCSHLLAPGGDVHGRHGPNRGGWDGAPQSIYSDHFLETQPIDGPIGFKLEVATPAPGDLCRHRAGIWPKAGRPVAPSSQRTHVAAGACCVTAFTSRPAVAGSSCAAMARRCWTTH